MRYITRATLLTRIASNASTSIFIPPGEVIEAEADPDNPVTVRLTWRGQQLRADRPEVARSASAAEAALSR